MILFYQPLIPEGIYHLDAEESRHCVKVLRRTKGDKIRITDGNGSFYDALITNADQNKCSFEIADQSLSPAKDYKIHIAISPTKNADRIEWFVEKSVEFGIDSITLIDCKHTERSFVKQERLEKIAISAMKQSLKSTLPSIHGLLSFNDLVSKSNEDEKFIAHVDHTNPHHLKDVAARSKKCLVVIGPEGDFSAEELAFASEHNFQKVSLGNSRLRTETAGLAACHILNLINA